MELRLSAGIVGQNERALEIHIRRLYFGCGDRTARYELGQSDRVI